MTTVQRGVKFRRPFVVPDSLDELHGPAKGALAIPLTVFWASLIPRVVGTSDDDALADVYRGDLETDAYAELTALVNKDALSRLWDNLPGNRAHRTAWEARFPHRPSPPRQGAGLET